VPRFLASHLPTLLWSALVALLLLTSGDLGAPVRPWLASLGVPGADKVIHGGLFFVEAVCLWRSLRAAGVGPGAASWGAALGAAVFGLVLEVAQLAVEGRFLETGDLVANAIGAALWPVARRLGRRD